MNKILISWIGLRSDLSNHQIRKDGPTYRFHEHFYHGYQKHLLLTTEREDLDETISGGLTVLSGVKRDFPSHVVELVYMDIQEKEVIDLNLIHSKLFKLLMPLSDVQMDFFISPGTGTMQLAWFMLHQELMVETRLLQTIKPEDTISNSPDLSEIQVRKSPYAGFLLTKEQKLTSTETSEFYITKSLEPIDKLIDQIALTDKTTVLIQGETGTGKEHFANQIKERSRRRNKPFVSINCASLSDELLESRLFGYKKGAFTGAISNMDGFFHSIDNGTIFLDEIGDITPRMQSSLLRVIQSGEFQRVGGTETEKVNVRIITATHKNLFLECERGNFRWDLYFRISVAEITIPSLKSRGTDEIVFLTEKFNEKFNNKYRFGSKPLMFAKDTLTQLTNYAWPGNVRELENLIERFYAYGIEHVKVKDLPKRILIPSTSLRLNDVIKTHVQMVHEQNGGVYSKTKEILDVGSVNTVKKYLNIS